MFAKSTHHDQWVDWIKQETIPFRSVDPADEDFSDLQGLKKLIGDARVVQLGEQSHGDGTCFETKIRLIKFLHQEMGFDVLAFESGLYDCRRAWHAFEDGEPARQAASNGVFGIWTGSNELLPLWEYLFEKAKTQRPLQLAGFDCQFTASASREDLIEDLEHMMDEHQIEIQNDETLDFLTTSINSLINGEKQEGSFKEFENAIDELTRALIAKWSDEKEPVRLDRLKFWIQEMKSLTAFANYQWKGAEDSNDESRMADVMHRDEQMAKNLVWMVNEQFPDRKIIVWAASFHIMRNPTEIDVLDGSIDYSDVIQMGHRVHEALGDKVFTVGFTAYEGEAGSCFGRPWNLPESPESTMESMFVEVGIENGVLPLPKASQQDWAKEKIIARPLGYSWMKADWSRVFDAMIFNKTMKPSTR